MQVLLAPLHRNCSLLQALKDSCHNGMIFGQHTFCLRDADFLHPHFPKCSLWEEHSLWIWVFSILCMGFHASSPLSINETHLENEI